MLHIRRPSQDTTPSTDDDQQYFKKLVNYAVFYTFFTYALHLLQIEVWLLLVTQ